MLNVKLGKKAARSDPRTLRLEKYIKFGILPPPPASSSWTPKVKTWGMMKNDVIGNCAIAGTGHLVEVWTANEAGSEVVIPDAQIVAAYSAISGYNPKTGAHDDGCVLIDVLNYWRSKGVGGHKIGSYMQVDPHNHTFVEDAVYLFGGAYIGLQLPISAQSQTGTGKTWAVPKQGLKGNGAPGSWGGHCVDLFSYDQAGLTCCTWGALQKMSWQFLDAYCDELFAVLSPDWVSKGRSPNGFNMAQLQTDLAGL